jgi:hypothetical protein
MATKVLNLSTPVSSKTSAHNVLYRLIGPMLNGFFKDNYWKGPNQLFNAIRAMGGNVEIEKTEYFAVNNVDMMGKRWNLTIEANGFKYFAILTASFADKPNGERYDLTLTV